LPPGARFGSAPDPPSRPEAWHPTRFTRSCRESTARVAGLSTNRPAPGGTRAPPSASLDPESGPDVHGEVILDPGGPAGLDFRPTWAFERPGFRGRGERDDRPTRRAGLRQDAGKSGPPPFPLAPGEVPGRHPLG